MNRPQIILIASLAVYGSAASAANACYRHTFDKCDAADAGVAQMAATQALPLLRISNGDAKPANAENSGWTTTVKTNR